MLKTPLTATVPLTASIVGARAELLRNGQNIGPLESEKKTHKERKHINNSFTGLSRDFGGEDFVYMCFSPNE